MSLHIPTIYIDSVVNSLIFKYLLIACDIDCLDDKI